MEHKKLSIRRRRISDPYIDSSLPPDGFGFFSDASSELHDVTDDVITVAILTDRTRPVGPILLLHGSVLRSDRYLRAVTMVSPRFRRSMMKRGPLNKLETMTCARSILRFFRTL